MNEHTGLVLTGQIAKFQQLQKKITKMRAPAHHPSKLSIVLSVDGPSNWNRGRQHLGHQNRDFTAKLQNIVKRSILQAATAHRASSILLPVHCAIHPISVSSQVPD